MTQGMQEIDGDGQMSDEDCGPDGKKPGPLRKVSRDGQTYDDFELIGKKPGPLVKVRRREMIFVENSTLQRGRRL